MLNGILVGPDATVSGFCSLNNPRHHAVAFVERPGLFKAEIDPRPAGIIIRKPFGELDGVGQIVVENPRLAFVKLMHYFHPPVVVESNFRHPTAVVDDDAVIGEPSHIGPGCVIESCAVIGSGCSLVADVFVGQNSKIGNDCLIQPGVKVLHDVRIGNRCIIGPGCVLGSDGFGFVPEGEKVLKVPQVGGVLIEDDVEMGANVTIDRATMDDTVIGEMTKLDNLIQVGHNVTIGKRVRIAAQSGLSGGARVGDDVVMGGQVGVAQGVIIGDGAMIGAQAGVTRHVPDGKAVSGYPAREHRHTLMVEACCQRLPELFKKFNLLVEELDRERD